MKCKDIIEMLEELAPTKYCESYDNVGLLVGSGNKEVKKIMIALDASNDVINQAVSQQIDLLITHHPLIFSPIKKITESNFIGKKVMDLIKNDITYYAMHTNYDVTAMADDAANRIGIRNKRPLYITATEKLYKIVVFVPMDSLDKVRDAMCKVGAGFIGNYSHCTFNVEGEGSFKPLDGTNPYIGNKDELTYVKEARIETVATDGNLNNIINAMLRVHPYEEVAYDVYELHNGGKVEGIGRYGYINEMTLSECADLVKEKFKLDYVTVCGSKDKKIEVVAISTGSGKSMIKNALEIGVDVLITGDIDHHTAKDAIDQGLAIIDAGHYGTEYIMKEYVKRYLENALAKSNGDWNLPIDIKGAEESNVFYVV